MKTLVTGATGFIGRHLVKTLVEQGRNVICLVRKTSNANYLKDLGAELFYGDVLDKDSLKGITRDVNIIYHLAGEVYSQRNKDYYLVNTNGTKNVLEMCRRNIIEKFIYLSSIAATGPIRKKGDLLNETTPYRPITPYGKSKCLGEKLLKEFSEKYGLPSLIIRTSTVYGPGVNTASRVFMFLERIDKGTFRIIGDGTNEISLCYVDNLIHGILLAEGRQISGHSTYIIADCKSYTIKEVSQKIAAELNTKISNISIPIWVVKVASFFYSFLKLKKSEVTISRYMLKEITHSWALDISKAEKELGYNPIIDFNQGIRRTVMWYKCRGTSEQ